MAWDAFTSTKPIARKVYQCQAAREIMDSDVIDYCDRDERFTIALAEAEGWSILPGSRYHKTTGIWEGKAATFRGREDLCKILDKYNLWLED